MSGRNLEAQESQPRPRKSNMTLIIVVLAGAGVLVVPCLLGLLLPAVQQAREAARRTSCRGNLQIIALALHNYHDEHRTFPPAYIADENGKPMHSWRVLILPYLGEQSLYEAYDFSEPWDGPNNRQLIDQMPINYACPSSEPNGTTTAYAAVVGEECVFAGDKPVKLIDIQDGASQTILIGEAAHAGITWTEPRDVPFDSFKGLGDPDGFSSDHVGGCHFMMADAHVQFISEEENTDSVRAWLTRSGGELVGLEN